MRKTHHIFRISGVSHEAHSLVILFFCFVLVVLGLELKAFTLSHSTSPIFVKGFS
jgi:hypothetical protein